MSLKTLTGAMVPRQVRRMVDQRDEPRAATGNRPARLRWRGRDHAVELINLSTSGAMVRFAGAARLDEPVILEIDGERDYRGRIRWVRDGRMGVHFIATIG